MTKLLIAAMASLTVTAPFGGNQFDTGDKKDSAGAAPYNFAYELEADRLPLLKTAGKRVLIKGAKVFTITKGTLPVADVLIDERGKIAKVGQNLTAGADAIVIDGRGKVLTPGLVDGHIHRGSDATNEGSDSITGEVRIEDVLNPTLSNVWGSLAAGETTGMLLHGSANAIGGQSTVIKLKYGKKPADMPIPDAPRMIKFALGENVTRSQSGTGTRFPRTRMGVQALYRRAFTEAKEYMKDWEAYEKGQTKVKPRRDLRLETLSDILRRRIWVQCHSYRADEMLMMVRLSQEFGFKLGNLQHGLEMYKIAPEMAKAGISGSIFADNWSFKLEGYDGIPYTASIATRAGVNVSVNTDGTNGVPSIIIDAAKSMRYGGLSEIECLRTLTINPAKSLGIAHRVGSIEVGKDADLVLWDGHPLSVYSKVQMTMIEGEVFFQRRDKFKVDGMKSPRSLNLPVNQKRSPLPIPANQKAYLVQGAKIVRVSKPTITGDVLIQGEKIVAIGQGLKPNGAFVINGKGLSVYPGFFDTGNSLGLAEISPVSESIDTTESGGDQPDLIASTAMQMQSEHFPVTRFGGVLVSMVRPSGATIPGQASLVHNQGWTTEDMRIGPDYLIVNFAGGSGPSNSADNCCIDLGGGFDPRDGSVVFGDFQRFFHGQEHKFNNLGSGDSNDHDHEHNGSPDPSEPMSFAMTSRAVAQSSSEMDKMVEATMAYKKKRAEFPPAVKIDLKQEALIPYFEGKKPIVLRVRSRAAIRGAVAWGKKHKLKIVLAGAPDAWKEADLLKKEKVPVLVNPAGKSTLFANAPANSWDPYDTPFAFPGLLERAGVKFAFQSEDNSGAFTLPVRVGQSCAYGLSQDRAVRALTLDAAEIMGVSDRLGSVDPGKLATVVITDGDPFELTTNIIGGFVKGRPLNLENRFTRLRDQWSKRLATK